MTPTLCRTGRAPHPGHPYSYQPGGTAYPCPGWPAPDTAAGRAAAIMYDSVMDGLHGDASGLDDGVAAAVARLAEAGLL